MSWVVDCLHIGCIVKITLIVTTSPHSPTLCLFPHFAAGSGSRRSGAAAVRRVVDAQLSAGRGANRQQRAALVVGMASGVDELALASVTPATIERGEAAIRAYVASLAASSVSPFPVSAEKLGSYLKGLYMTALAGGKTRAVEYYSKALTILKGGVLRRGRAWLTEAEEAKVRKAASTLSVATPVTAESQAEPMDVPTMRDLVKSDSAMPLLLKELVRALVVIGTWSLMRSGELLQLTWGQVTISGDSVSFFLPFTKTDRSVTIAVFSAPAELADVCPVAATKRWLRAWSTLYERQQGCAPTEGRRLGMMVFPSFSAVERKAKWSLCMTNQQMIASLRQRLRELPGVDQTRAERYSGHSMRRGGATIMAKAGQSLDTIKKVGRWRSDTASRYMEMSDRELAALVSSSVLAGAKAQVCRVEARAGTARTATRAVAPTQRASSSEPPRKRQRPSSSSATAGSGSAGAADAGAQRQGGASAVASPDSDESRASDSGDSCAGGECADGAESSDGSDGAQRKDEGGRPQRNVANKYARLAYLSMRRE